MAEFSGAFGWGYGDSHRVEQAKETFSRAVGFANDLGAALTRPIIG
jgi:hypothetical protein